jgi:pimeloyl-ACP methyl ester carboxylesterase
MLGGSVVKTVNINGNTIEYKDVGSGVPLLLLHTLLADNSVYDRVIPDLAKNFRVISPNFPGYGGSTGEVKGGIEAYAAIVPAWQRFRRVRRPGRGDCLSGAGEAPDAGRHGSRFS